MSEPIVIGEKNVHKGAMHGHISNCGGTIDLGNGKSIKFIGINEMYLTIQLLEHGIGKEVKTSSWQKSKKVIVKKTVIKKVKQKPTQETLLDKEAVSEEKEVLF